MNKERERKGGHMAKVEGEVYCLEHCTTHEDTTDPYGYGEADCRKSDHRLIYWRTRNGDIA